MSCHLLHFSHFHDAVGVRNYLFPDLKEAPATSLKDHKPGNKDGDGWDTEDWDNWNEEEEEEEEQSDNSQADKLPDKSHKWLQDCNVSVSPAADLIALSYQQRMVLLAPKYDPERRASDSSIQFATVWQGCVAHDKIESVTALLCLPLASQKRSTQGAPDWTCVLVGFSSGYLRMYTETGALLLSQRLHTEVVTKLKCSTYSPPRYLGVAEQHEELVILYKRVLVTIDGFSLFQALKACRNQVARATASGETSLQPPPLAYKKWSPQEQDKLYDCHSAGVNTPNPFDQMVLASSHYHSANIRPAMPTASMYLLSGVGPYVGFYYAIEGSTQPILSEVAYAVASKLKSAIMSAASGWLSFGGKSKTEDERRPKIEPATPLPLRFGLPDQRREGLSICVSPNNMYAATTDSFGRVMLIDVARGIALRMWKGYRDAQVGWIEVKEDEEGHRSRSKYGRIAQFLVIYAARRGIVEVWMPGTGLRVAAFNVSKYCRLINMSYGIMGLNNVTSRGVSCKAFQCALMDSDGTVKTVEVPFHLSLSDKNNKRVRDMHLLKKLKLVLKENHSESEGLETQVKDLLLNIRISNIAQQGIERVLTTKYLSPAFYLSVLQAATTKLKALGEEHLNIDQRLFIQYCRIQEHLVNTYLEIQALSHEEDQTDTGVQALGKLLSLTHSEAEHIVSQINCYETITSNNRSQSHARVRFQSDEAISHISEFLSCFSCHPHITEQQDGGAQSGSSAISIVSDLTEERRLHLGTFLFGSCLKGHASVSDLGAILRKCHVPMQETGHLLIWTWSSEDGRPVTVIQSLFNILKIITSSLDGGCITSWCQMVRDICSKSTNCHSAYLACVIARSVAMEMIGSQARSKDHDGDSGGLVNAKDPDADTVSYHSDRASLDSSVVVEWDSVSADIETWNILVRQLEDLAAINCMLKLTPDNKDQLKESEPITVSVSTMLEGGKVHDLSTIGCITEIVARHVARVGFQPTDLYEPIPDDLSQENMGTSPSETQVAQPKKNLVKEQMHQLQQRFPHSLENDVHFCNCCWEYTVQWNKDPEDVASLQSAIDFLVLVQNAVLRQGVASMMWHMFLLKRFQPSAQLIEKVGKVPKERLCKKEIGISETRLPNFIGIIRDFFSILMEANCEVNEVPVFNLEPLWNQVKGTVSLVELAVDQKQCNYGLLKLHHQLVTLMHAVATFNMKSARVISLFDSKGKNAFFSELFSHPLLPSQVTDISISVLRKQFLIRVVTQAVLLMNSTLHTDTEDGTPLSLNRIKSTTTAKWPGTVTELAQDFDIDVDDLRRHHVCELYSAGFDELAEEIMVTVNDHESLGTQLLTLIGQRIAQNLSTRQGPKVVEIMSNVNPTLSSWLKAMNPKLLVNSNCPLSSLPGLISHTVNQLPEGHREYELAISLVDLIQTLSHPQGNETVQT